MKWSDFGPYVLPYVVGVPEPLLELHARLAAIEFCRRTLCYTRTLDAVTTDGTPIVELESLPSTQIIKIKAVEVNGKSHPLVEPQQGLEFVRSASPLEFCFTQENLFLHVYPVQEAGVSVVVDAALAPTLRSTDFSDEVANPYLQDIAFGVIASLQRVPGQPFSDLNASALHTMQFERRIGVVAGKMSRGLLSSKMRSHARLL